MKDLGDALCGGTDVVVRSGREAEKLGLNPGSNTNWH